MKKEKWLTIGYYIVEPVTKPEGISLPCKQIISSSNCISIHHPDLDEFFWLGREEKAGTYQEKLRLSDSTFLQLKEDISILLDEMKMGTDGIFCHLKDAKEIYQKYFFKDNKIRIIGISVEDFYTDVLQEERGHSDWLHKQEAQGKLLGFEIIGWDFSGFHSYLCNGLERTIEEDYLLRVDHQGLIQNSYEEVVNFTKRIKGMGEPVEWVPVAVYDCNELL